MNNNKTKFEIIFPFIFMFLWSTLVIFVFTLILLSVLNGESNLNESIGILTVLIVMFLFGRLLIQVCTGFVDIDLIRYLFAKIKYFIVRYICKNKEYKFKYKTLSEIHKAKKTQKEQEKTTPSRNFLRFYRNKKDCHIFANKFCLVIIDYNENKLSYFDKISQEGYCNNNDEYPINKSILKKIYNTFCTSFSYNTDINQAIELIKSYLYIGYRNINIPYKPNKTNIYNMSIAELAALPGINLGKANKIHSYRKHNPPFNDIEHFLEFSDVNNDDSQTLREMFWSNLDYKSDKHFE